MINWPKEPSGSSKAAHFLRNLLRACRQLEIKPGPDHLIGRDPSGGIFLKNVLPGAGGAVAASGGRFRGQGWDNTDVTFPQLTYAPYDFIFYKSADGVAASERSLWLFAWSGITVGAGSVVGGDGTGGTDKGPIYRLSQGEFYITPTPGAWFLMSYSAIDSNSDFYPSSAAQGFLLASYPEQL